MKHILLLLLIGLTACSEKPTSGNGQVVTIKQEVNMTTLFYSGVVQPIRTTAVISPVDGALVDMPLPYGETVTIGQHLFSIASTKFLNDFKMAFMAYLKAKSEASNSKTLLDEATFLHKNELISDDEFKSKQTNFYVAQLALLQAKDGFEQLVNQSGGHGAELYQLSIADIDKVTQAMYRNASAESLQVIAPVTGVLLAPLKNAEEYKKWQKGDAVKQDDVLALVGDMSGISVKIKVNELTVNQLKVGDKVQLTGVAFADDVLEGHISRIDHQGEVLNGGLPVFSIEVEAPLLTDRQRQLIRVGMSVQVQLSLGSEAAIMAPIKAVLSENGHYYVMVLSENNRQPQKVLVTTGRTTADAVTILSGLKSGDRLVIPD